MSPQTPGQFTKSTQKCNTLSNMKSNNTCNRPSSNTDIQMPQTATFTPISIDWLSLSCKVISAPNQVYQVERSKYSTSLFKYVDHYKHNTITFATVTHTPKSGILPPDTAIVKFSNWLLYDEFSMLNIWRIIEELGLKYEGINRCDIAIDLNTFANNLQPESLIKGYFTGKYTKIGRGKFKTIGRNHSSVIFDYLRFGNYRSSFSVYLYNKSQEFREVEDKLHIRQAWSAAGLNDNIDVWRLEVSIKGRGNYVTDMETGEMHEINLTSILDDYSLKMIYKTAIAIHFDIRHQQQNKRRENLKKLQLFRNWGDVKHKLVNVTRQSDPTKMKKATLKILVDTWDEIRENKKHETNEIREAARILAEYYNLTKYLNEKTKYENLLSLEDDEK
jgi:hypothetical protein